MPREMSSHGTQTVVASHQHVTSRRSCRRDPRCLRLLSRSERRQSSQRHPSLMYIARVPWTRTTGGRPLTVWVPPSSATTRASRDFFFLELLDGEEHADAFACQFRVPFVEVDTDRFASVTNRDSERSA